MFLLARNRKVLMSGLVIAALAALPASAHEHDRSPHPASGPEATLSAQASSVVPQDAVQITLASELKAASQADVAQALNKVLDATMRQAKGHEGIEARSGAYRIWPVTRQESEATEWWGRGEIVLSSSDMDAVAKLASDLGDRMPIAGMVFSITPQRRAAEEKALLEQAVQAFKVRAQALTQALGFESYRYRNIDLGGEGAPVQPMPRMMMSAMASDKVAAPVEAGSETITVSVHGTIALQPANK